MFAQALADGTMNNFFKLIEQFRTQVGVECWKRNKAMQCCDSANRTAQCGAVWRSGILADCCGACPTRPSPLPQADLP